MDTLAAMLTVSLTLTHTIGAAVELTIILVQIPERHVSSILAATVHEQLHFENSGVRRDDVRIPSRVIKVFCRWSLTWTNCAVTE